MKQEITRQMAEEMVEAHIKLANEEFDKSKSRSTVPHVYDEDARRAHNLGWLKSAFATAIVKNQLTKEDLQ